MHERRGADWGTDGDDVNTTPGKRITPEMAQRIAQVRAESAQVDVIEVGDELVAAFDLSDVRRR